MTDMSGRFTDEQAEALSVPVQTVMVVDDNPANLGVVGEHLEGNNYNVTVAQDGNEALKRAELVLPDLILLDVMMPGIDGFETCRQLKANPATCDIPVIFMTALAEVSDKLAAFQAGGVDYISKPFQTEELMARVRTHLALRDATIRLAKKNALLQKEIQARSEAEARIRHLALHDALTGLPNRTLLADRLEQAIAQARRTAQTVAVMMLDLDHFKDINDSLGHHVGDILLQTVANRLRGCMRANDTAARLGGDEFVLLLGDANGPQDIDEVAGKVIHALRQPFPIGQHQLHIGGSIGVSLFPHDGEDANNLLRAADTAMYDAKGSGRGVHRLFTHAMSEAAIRRQELANDIHMATANGEFTLHYQPQVSLDDHRITGVEALLRWNHPTQGLVLPSLFVPLLEELGLIVEVGDWVLLEACRQNMAWQAAGLEPIRMGVNLSPHQFHRGDIVSSVERALNRSGLEPRWLELELTESLTLDDTEMTIQTMSRLKALGVGLSLDDFGTGWSSLSYLRRLPLDRIKIDRSFMSEVSTQPNAAAVVQGIFNLAESLGLRCVAEGVEDNEQLEYLKRHLCSEIQGFLFSHPLAPDEVASALTSNRPIE